ncbi:DUF1266 domain-containing protein [Allonocardiopsis opalescens]|uniref:Uncharacterized protein DUF1266 n=1 Tax=Allonocardiopsis opalescens TaxID=1144618 RepID=A0A2T0Q471_9ACTN|nr:DUF1266 domain-containing protein [Allonocardiopsis opalescens]PRX98553.1 uncharacterized protein DUF1266 [Allonocardiopsis opalescens]
MVTVIVGVLGGLVIVGWGLLAWASDRRLLWYLAPLALAVVVLVGLGWVWWAVGAVLALALGTFGVLAYAGADEPALRTQDPKGAPSTRRWALAAAAPFRVAVAEPWDVTVHPILRRLYRARLYRRWGVTSRDELLMTLEQLWRSRHDDDGTDLLVRPGRGEVVRRLGEPEPALEPVPLTNGQRARVAGLVGAEPAEGGDAEAVEVVIGNYRLWELVPFLHLSLAGATVGWLSEPETDSLLAHAAVELQRRFGSWRELAQAFHAGYLLWRPTPDDDYDQRLRGALTILLSASDGPWQLVAWDMPIEPPVENSLPWSVPAE